MIYDTSWCLIYDRIEHHEGYVIETDTHRTRIHGVVMKLATLALAIALLPVVSDANAGSVLSGVDKYMADKPARILEVRKLCQGTQDRAKVESGKQAMLFVCAFDTAHTTGFNAATQDKGQHVDIHKVQSMDYTFETMNVIHKSIKECMKVRNITPTNAWQDDDVAYCVAIRGYEYGKLYGQKHLDSISR